LGDRSRRTSPNRSSRSRVLVPLSRRL
jgi:hypothetical protein